MARKMTEWPSKRGPITKIMPSDGCIGDTVPLAVGKWYDFHEFGWYMGNVGVNNLIAAFLILHGDLDCLELVHGQQRKGDLDGPLLVVGSRIHRPVVADAYMDFEYRWFAVCHVPYPASRLSALAPTLGNGLVLISHIVRARHDDG